MRRALLAVALIAPLSADAREHLCHVERVATHAKSADEKEPGLAVYAFWPSGVIITHSDGTRTSYDYRVANERYLRESEERIRAGEKPLAPPARLTRGPHFVLLVGDQAHASVPHHSCAFTAKAEAGGLVLEVEATYCDHGRCDKATEVVPPEVVEQ